MKKRIMLWLVTGCMAFLAVAGAKLGLSEVYAASASTGTVALKTSEKTVDSKASEASTDSKASGSSEEIETLYNDILYQYKLAKVRKYTGEQMDERGLITVLSDIGWPSLDPKEEIRYLFYDVDENGTDELIITCGDEIADIYGYDGFKVRHVFGNPVGDKAELYPGGMLKTESSYSETDDCETWYQFDTGMGDFFPVFEMYSYEDSDNEYYTFGFDEASRDEIESAYRESGWYPVWTYEWLDMITDKEYAKLCPKEPAVKIPKGTSISDIELPCPLNTEKEITSFLAGEWTMINPETAKDGGTLKIKKDGSFTYTRGSDKETGNGTISFEHVVSEKNEEPDYFRLEFEDIEELLPEGCETYEGSPTDTNGLFHIGSDGDKDYLYLKQIGNGDTLVSSYAFNENEDLNDFENWPVEWVFYRKNSVHEASTPKKNDSFYAWAWKKDKDGSLWLQKMVPHTYETNEEYCDRALMGGYFSEDADIGVANYKLSKEADTSGLFNVIEWERENPLFMYRVKTDEKGMISNIEELDLSLFGAYDMGYLEPEFSVSKDGKTFYYNNSQMELEDIAPDATAIMDATLAGDWIVLDCHVSPHYSLYEFFNINMGSFVYEIMGANLNWQNNDLATAVYSKDNGIYDFWGNKIAYTEEGADIYELSYLNFRTLHIEFTIMEDGKEVECAGKLEYMPEDHAVFDYYNYLFSGAPSKWREFMKQAPEDAQAFIMVDPPQTMVDWFPGLPISDEDNASDKLAVVSLRRDQKIHIESKDPDAGRRNKNYTEAVIVPALGDVIVYDITVPERNPDATLIVRTKGKGEVLWDITQLSGETLRISEFLPEKE